MTSKKGDKLECKKCGLKILVESPCTCDSSCKITCCGKALELTE
ncbi:hypothetical protein [Candidatus Bathycorpusculum sp.]